MKYRAIFLDRDGVINKNISRDGKTYSPLNLEEFEILPNVFEACMLLKKVGYIIVVATNQPDVGRGLIKKEIVESMHSVLNKKLPIDHIEVCYHPGKNISNCDCRKPLPGMLIRAESKLKLDLKNSWMIGDRTTDIECGQLAGCKTILICNNYKDSIKTPPNYLAKDLLDAVTIILK